MELQPGLLQLVMVLAMALLQGRRQQQQRLMMMLQQEDSDSQKKIPMRLGLLEVLLVVADQRQQKRRPLLQVQQIVVKLRRVWAAALVCLDMTHDLRSKGVNQQRRVWVLLVQI
jgi:hypothetical protein